jgi:cardiolipin synthase
LKPALTANFRNHRKLAIVDHELAFTGGINIANEYRYGLWEGVPWFDLGVEVRGPVVRDLEVVFCDDWIFTTGEEVEVGGFPVLLAEGTPLQVVTGGPDHPLEPISHLVTTILSRCNHEAVLITPYFIPDPPLLHTLASLKLRGGKVNLIVPEQGNHFWVHRATESYYRDLFAMGIEPWLFEPGMIHTKLLWADRLLALVGSPNLDIRSLKLNFELALLFFDPRDLNQVEVMVEEIMQYTAPLSYEKYQRFSRLRRSLNGIARVMSPIF